MNANPFKNVGWIGIAVVLTSLLLMFVFPAKVGPMPAGFSTPVIAFEFVQTPEEVEALFSGPDGPATIEAMDVGNRIDFVYMVLYSVFLFWFSFTAYRQSGIRILYIAMFLSAVVIVGDILENIQLLSITAKLRGEGYQGTDIQPELALLRIFTWQKWAGLALSFLCLIPYWITLRRFAVVLTLASILTAACGMAAFLHRSVMNEIFAMAVALMFLLMIVFCFLPLKVTIKITKE